MKKKDILGKWLNLNKINPNEVEDLKPGDYVNLRIEYKCKEFDYKLAWVSSIEDGQIRFHILNVDISYTPITIKAFCVLPDYTNINFYKPE